MEAVKAAPFSLPITAVINHIIHLHSSEKSIFALQGKDNHCGQRHIMGCEEDVWVLVVSHINVLIFWVQRSQLKFLTMNGNIQLLWRAVNTGK